MRDFPGLHADRVLGPHRDSGVPRGRDGGRALQPDPRRERWYGAFHLRGDRGNGAARPRALRRGGAHGDSLGGRLLLLHGDRDRRGRLHGRGDLRRPGVPRGHDHALDTAGRLGGDGLQPGAHGGRRNGSLRLHPRLGVASVGSRREPGRSALRHADAEWNVLVRRHRDGRQRLSGPGQLLARRHGRAADDHEPATFTGSGGWLHPFDRGNGVRRGRYDLRERGGLPGDVRVAHPRDGCASRLGDSGERRDHGDGDESRADGRDVEPREPDVLHRAGGAGQSDDPSSRQPDGAVDGNRLPRRELAAARERADPHFVRVPDQRRRLHERRRHERGGGAAREQRSDHAPRAREMQRVRDRPRGFQPDLLPRAARGRLHLLVRARRGPGHFHRHELATGDELALDLRRRDDLDPPVADAHVHDRRCPPGRTDRIERVGLEHEDQGSDGVRRHFGRGRCHELRARLRDVRRRALDAAGGFRLSGRAGLAARLGRFRGRNRRLSEVPRAGRPRRAGTAALDPRWRDRRQRRRRLRPRRALHARARFGAPDRSHPPPASGRRKQEEQARMTRRRALREWTAVSTVVALLLTCSPPAARAQLESAQMPEAPIEIAHDPLACMTPVLAPEVDAGVTPATDYEKGYVYFRAAGTDDYYYVKMEGPPTTLAGVLPRPLPETKAVDYFLRAYDLRQASKRKGDWTPPVVPGTTCKAKGVVVGPQGAGLTVGLMREGQNPHPPGFDKRDIARVILVTGAIVTIAQALKTGGASSGGASAGAASAGAAGGLSTVAIVAGAAAVAGAGIAIASANDDEPNPTSTPPPTST